MLKPSCTYLTLLSCLSLLPQVVTANDNEATLTPSLKLHIPVIHYQNADGVQQRLWADMQYQANESNPLLFSVQNYGAIAGSGDHPSPTLKRLSLVTENQPPKINVINSQEAQLLFVSSIPLACSVVYGTTPEFGMIAVDQDMDGGAHRNHQPFLTGLQADTHYFYRVQGTAANGDMYHGEISSFYTPLENSSAVKNLLSLQNGAVVTAVSSNFGNADNTATWGADSAIDNSSATAWSSNGDGDQAFIEISLPAPAPISTVQVWSRAMNDGSAIIISFKITSGDGESFGPFTLPDTSKAYTYPIGKMTSQLKLEVISSTGGNTGLVEFSAF